MDFTNPVFYIYTKYFIVPKFSIYLIYIREFGIILLFSIVKFRKQTNGTVNTCETGIPENIKTDQAWIAETPVGGWFYGPNFVYSSDAVIRYLLEIVARDGAVGVSIPLRPDGSLDEGW